MTDAELKRLRKRVANQARAAGRFQATAEIVAYLEGASRGCHGGDHPKWRYYAAALTTAADDIKRGDHLKVSK